MEFSLSTFFIVSNLIVVIALAASPFIFFSVFAEQQDIWKIMIMEGASVPNLANSFYPDELPVRVGDTIIWENSDVVTHSIASGVPEYPDYAGSYFYPGEVESGKSVSYVFDNSDFNAFYYFCEIHPWMTGKIFTSNLAIAQPETYNPIKTEKLSYSYGESMTISGEVHEDFAETEYQLLIYDQNNNLVDLTFGNFNEDATYLHTSQAKGVGWVNSGEYQIKLVYAVPSKVAQTSFQFSANMISDTVTPSIPIWIKNVGKFWCNDQIDDAEFVGAIQYLIKNNIIVLEQKMPNSGISQHVPAWIKNNACWWVDNKISERDFVSGIEFLVEIGTIKV